MPSSSSICAMRSLSSRENEIDSPWLPSRSVVSKIEIFICFYEQRSCSQVGCNYLQRSNFYFLRSCRERQLNTSGEDLKESTWGHYPREYVVRGPRRDCRISRFMARAFWFK